MAVIDVEQLLAEISPDAPSGEDLEYDPDFGEMERAAQGKPEQQVGDATVPAEEPDWRTVKAKSTNLLGRTKDMRVAVHLVRALTHTDGLIGLDEGLTLLQSMLERFWDDVHPQLDPEDDLDPTARVNVLLSLCDPESMLHSVRVTPLVESRMMGRFSLRDMQIAAGEIPVPEGSEGQAPQLSAIEAAFMDVDLETLQATAAATREAIERVTAIEALMTDKVGTSHAVSLDPLTNVLKEAQKALAEQLERRGVQTEVAADELAEGAAPAAAAAQPAAPGTISTPEDVIRAIDRINEYYRRHEPSSPVPLLLERAKRLVSKDFMEILKDLAPDGLTQAQSVTGAQAESEY